MPSAVDVPAPNLPPPPVRVPVVEQAAPAATPDAEPLFTVKVWQLGLVVFVVLLALLYALGIL
jgi:hypothetical protein